MTVRRSFGRALAALALIALGLVLLHLYEPADRTRLALSLQNAGHGLLFFVIALLVLSALRALGDGGRGCYLRALAITLLLGGLSEWLQVASPVRDASVEDWLRDAAGAVAALCLAAALRRSTQRTTARAALVMVALACIGAIAAPPVATWLDYRARDAVFPRLCCFTGAWERRFVRSNHLELAPAAADAVPAGEGFLRMRFSPARWPGLSVHEVYPDWSGYDTLAFDVYAETPAPVAVVLRVDDLDHDGVTFADRFNRDLKIEAGMNRFRVPVAEILEAPDGRRMDVTRMKRIFLFADGPQAQFTLYWNGFRLLPEAERQP